jgi:hypothetical protein
MIFLMPKRETRILVLKSRQARCSPRKDALPILPDKTAEYKAIDGRRLLTENGLSSIGLESRFYAVVRGCSSGLALNPRRSKSRGGTETAKGHERAESIEMALLRLVSIK